MLQFVDCLHQLECKLLESRDQEQGLFYSWTYPMHLRPCLIQRRGSVDPYHRERGRQVCNGTWWTLGSKTHRNSVVQTTRQAFFKKSLETCLGVVIKLAKQIARIKKKKKKKKEKKCWQTVRLGTGIRMGGNLIHFSKHVPTKRQVLRRSRWTSTAFQRKEDCVF